MIDVGIDDAYDKTFSEKYENGISHIRGRAWLIHFRIHGTINFVMLLVRLQGFPGPIVTHKRHGVNLAKLLSGF